MTESTHLRAQMFRLTWPIFIEFLLLMLVGLIDVLMLSRISDASVAAVGLVNQLLNMVFLVFAVGAMGTSAVCAQYIGARQMDNFTQSAGVSIVLNTVLGAICSFTLYFCAASILNLMDAGVEIFDFALVYLKIVGGWAILHGLIVTIGSILRSRDMATYPMYVAIIGNLVNFVGNYLLIFGKCGFPEMGVEGAAWATVISRIVTLIFLFFILFRRGLERSLFRNMRPFPWDKLRKIMSIGIPGAGEMFSYSFSQVVIAYFINMLGTEALASRSYVANCVTFTFLFSLAVGQSASISVGHLVGKRQYNAALLLGEYALRLSALVTFILSVCMAVASRFFMPLLTSNAAILQLCLYLFLIDIILEIGRAVNILTGRMLAAVGNPIFPLVTSLCVVWTVATGGSYVTGIMLGYGLTGMWLAFLADECLRAIIQWRHWRSKGWMNKGFC